MSAQENRPLTELQWVRRVVANYKNQYCKRGKWATYDDWQIQPEQIHRALTEVRTIDAVDALLGNGSWTKTARRKLRTHIREVLP